METHTFNPRDICPSDISPRDISPSDSTAYLTPVFAIRPYEGRIPLDTKPLLQILAGAYHDGIRYLSVGRVPVQPLFRELVTKATRSWFANQDTTRGTIIYNNIISGTHEEVRLMLGVKGVEHDYRQGLTTLNAAQNAFAYDFLRHDINDHLQGIGAKPELVLVLQQVMSDHPLSVEWTAPHYPDSLARLLQTFSIPLDITTASLSRRVMDGDEQPQVANQPCADYAPKPAMDLQSDE